MHNWGWRVPFALGLLVALTGLALRRSLHSETPPTTASRPLQDLARHQGAVLRVLLLNVASSVAFYTAFVYVITTSKPKQGRAKPCSQHPCHGIAVDLLPNRRLDLGSAVAGHC